jgi:hypothetical protein
MTGLFPSGALSRLCSPIRESRAIVWQIAINDACGKLMYVRIPPFLSRLSKASFSTQQSFANLCRFEKSDTDEHVGQGYSVVDANNDTDCVHNRTPELFPSILGYLPLIIIKNVFRTLGAFSTPAQTLSGRRTTAQ